MPQPPDDDEVVELTLVEVRDNRLGLVVAVPRGWYLEDEPGRPTLLAVADTDDLAAGPLRPWLRVTRYPTATYEEAVTHAARQVDALRRGARDVHVDWVTEERDDDRILRALEYEPVGVGTRVRSVQGVVAGPALLTVELCTPVDGGNLDDVGIAVAWSLRHDDVVTGATEPVAP